MCVRQSRQLQMDKNTNTNTEPINGVNTDKRACLLKQPQLDIHGAPRYELLRKQMLRRLQNAQCAHLGVDVAIRCDVE